MSEPVTRREAAKMIVAAPALGSVWAAGDKVSFGLIGCGARGQYLLGYLNRLGGARCAAACDTDESSLRKAVQASRDKPAGFKDARDLLARKDIQAVLIATPPHTHFPLVRDALDAAKHVFCENVLAVNINEISALRQLADKHSDQVIQVGLARRYSRFYQIARQMASKGFLGEVTNIQAQWHRSQDWVMKPDQPKERNWRLLREFSGGLTTELASHQIDVANWIFGDTPEFITGVGGLDWHRDGRDVYDNIALICRYADGKQLTSTAISTNHHLPLFASRRSECGEMVMGTEGTLELSFGVGDEPPLGMWFYEPGGPRATSAEERAEVAKAVGATVTSAGSARRGIPIFLEQDQLTGEEKFIEREMKYARRWLYARGVMAPDEGRHPVEVMLDEFFESCRSGKRVKAGLNPGLDTALSVIAANKAMDEGRRVKLAELVKA